MQNEEAIITCGTTKGDIVLELHRQWSPNGYDRAVTLFESGFYDHSHFYRVVQNFLVQFGISYSDDKELQGMAHQTISDDPQLDPPVAFERGTISYAGSGPNSRTTQLFFAYKHSDSLGTQLWETPIGKVIEGMDHVEDFYSYGDMPPWGKGPVQGEIHSGRAYIDENFPLTDAFVECHVARKQLSDKSEAVERELTTTSQQHITVPLTKKVDPAQLHKRIRNAVGEHLAVDATLGQLLSALGVLAMLVVGAIVIRSRSHKAAATKSQ